MISVIVMAIAAAPLPSEKELGRALAYRESCVDTDGYTLCGPQPIGAKFRQYLCVEYGSDLEKRVIVRCVFKGAEMIMRPFRGTTRVAVGDGAIDVTRGAFGWVPYS